MADPTGTYIAMPDGFWWSGGHKAGAWQTSTGNFPNADVGSLPVGTANYTPPGGALYVATSGNDTTGDGSVGNPYASLTHAVSVASASSTIVVRAGVYYEGGDTQSGSATTGITITNQLTIQNYPNETVWFDGSQPVTSWTASGGLWTASYDRLLDRTPSDQRGQADTSGWVNPAYPYAPWPDMVLLDGTQLTPVGSKADLVTGTFFIEGASTGSGYWFQGSAIWLADDPSDHQISVTGKVRFMTIQAVGCTLRGVGVRRYSNSNPDTGVITALRDNTLLENVWIEDTSDDGISLQGSPTTSGANQIGRKITCRRNGHLGTQGYMADNLLYDRVDIQYANYHRWNNAPQAGGSKIVKSQTVTIKDCLYANIHAKGLWFDQSVDNPSVIGTMFLNTDDHGIKMEVATNRGLVANCLFVNTARDGIQINDVDNVQLWNCTFVNCASTSGSNRPVSWNQDARRPDNYPPNKDQRQPDSYYDLPQNQWQINHVTMHNCIIADPAGGAQGMFAIDDSQRSTDQDRAFSDYNVDMDYNLYQWINKPTYPWIYPSVAAASGKNRTSQTLTDFQSKTGQDTHSFLVTGSAVLNSGDSLIDPSYHTSAKAIPSDIATAMDVTAGTKHMGAFV